MKSEDKTTRRDFLKFAGTAAPIAAVALAGGTEVAEAAADEIKSSGLQDTPHTRAYLASARF